MGLESILSGKNRGFWGHSGFFWVQKYIKRLKKAHQKEKTFNFQLSTFNFFVPSRHETKKIR